MDEKRLELLLHRYFDQVLTHEERQELELTLLSSPRARELFWEMARWNALIRHWGEAEWGRCDAENYLLKINAPVNIARHVTAKFASAKLFYQRALRWLLPVTAAAVIIFSCVMGYRALFPQGEFRPSKGIVTLTRISEAGWDKNRKAMQVGEALQPGWLRLDHGAVQIEFSKGARVILEAPAELQLISENEAFLRSGKLSAHVPPPAHGFKIDTAEFSVVDHGTEFGCAVGEAGEAQVHVFAGQVSWKPSDKNLPGRELKINQALQISHQLAQPIPADHAVFLSEDEMAKLDTAREHARLADWRGTSRWLRENPATLVYLDFERETDNARTLPNLALNAAPNSDASIIGCDSADGRWTDKSAVEFKRSDDRLRLTVPGEFKSLTFLAWVRVDSLPDRQQSLAMTESFVQGETHWFLYRDGSLGLGVHVNASDATHGWRTYKSESEVKPENYGIWTLVATVCNGVTGEITHYMDGELVGRGTGNVLVPLRLDTFEIGNWGVRYNDPRWPTIEWGSPDDAVRNFHGRMDEFAILATALQPEDIQKLYREGRPGETILTVASQ